MNMGIPRKATIREHCPHKAPDKVRMTQNNITEQHINENRLRKQTGTATKTPPQNGQQQLFEERAGGDGRNWAIPMVKL